MTTTCMRDSSVGDDWIRRSVEATPIQPVLDPTTNKPSGNFLTGPVRLAFPNLFKPGKAQREGEEGKYDCVALFTPYHDFSLLYQAYFECLGQNFAEYYDAQSGQYHGLHSPFRDQAEKAAKYSGYTPGNVFMTCQSKYKPPLVDGRRNPIVDESRVYAGVWAILSINAYHFGKSPPQPIKGAKFGLQSVMIIADDDRLGGGAPDPNAQFAGANVTPPANQPAAAFGMPGAQPAMPPGTVAMPGMGGAPVAPAASPVAPAPGMPAPASPPAAAPPAAAPPAADDDISGLL